MIDTGTWRRALSIALPLMIAESINSILWLTDTFFVSRLGDAAIAAVGLGGYLSWLTFVGGTLFYMGAMVLVSQAYGAGELGKAERSAGEALSSNILLSLPVVAAMWAASPGILGFLGGPRVGRKTILLAIDYYRARLIGVPFAYAGLVLGAVYRAVGRTKPVMVSTTIAAVANAILDPLLIFGLASLPRLGVAGAGYASAAAALIDASTLWLLSKKTIGFQVTPKPPGSLAFQGARIGLPAFIERLAFVTGNMAYIGAVSRCGEKALAAHTIGVRIESLAFLPLFSISEAAAAIAGQETGAERIREAKKAGWQVALLNGAAGIVTMAAIILLSGLLPRAFTSDPQVVRLARLYLIIAALTEPPFGMVLSLGMAIRGAGNTIVPTIVNLTGLYLLRVVPASILPGHMPPGLCVLGAWLAMAIDVSGRSIIMAVIYVKYFEKIARKVV